MCKEVSLKTGKESNATSENDTENNSRALLIILNLNKRLDNFCTKTKCDIYCIFHLPAPGLALLKYHYISIQWRGDVRGIHKRHISDRGSPNFQSPNILNKLCSKDSGKHFSDISIYNQATDASKRHLCRSMDWSLGSGKHHTFHNKTHIGQRVEMGKLVQLWGEGMFLPSCLSKFVFEIKHCRNVIKTKLWSIMAQYVPK